PDSLRLEQGEEAVRAAVMGAEDAVVAELERAIPARASREPQVQAKAAAAVAELLRPIPDAVLRYGYARIASDRLGIPVEMLSRRMGGAERLERLESSRARALPAPVPGEAGGGPRLVRSLEEQVLEVLLRREEDSAALPPFDQLPPPEVF